VSYAVEVGPGDLAALLAAVTAPPWREYGRSVAGRPLTCRHWPATAPPGAPAAPAVLLFGSIHGNEPLGSFCLARLAEALDAEVASRSREVWIAPISNPDGFLLGRKNNDHDVDLNRNWPARNWAPAHRPGESPGPRAASEPETQALAALIAKAGATRLIALHSPFRTVNYDGPAQALAERMAARNGYGASADIGYPTPGSFGSCYGVERGLEVITLEIPVMRAAQAWSENREALLEALG
jgi:protein MpaA